MSDNKKYYYLKLKENFFDRDEIKVIKGMPKGDTYVCIMLEMHLRSLKRGGKLMMTDAIPYNLQTLSSVLSRDEDEVKYAVDLFSQFGLVEQLDSGAIFMSDIQNFIGTSSTEGDRKRAYRNGIEAAKTEGLGHLSDNRPPKIEIKTEIKTEKETHTPLTPQGEFASDYQDEQLSVVVNLWDSEAGTVSIVDPALKRSFRNLRRQGYTLQMICDSVTNYWKILKDPNTFYTYSFDLFKFLRERVGEFLHAKAENMQKREEKQSPQRPARKPSASGVQNFMNGGKFE